MRKLIVLAVLAGFGFRTHEYPLAVYSYKISNGKYLDLWMYKGGRASLMLVGGHDEIELYYHGEDEVDTFYSLSSNSTAVMQQVHYKDPVMVATFVPHFPADFTFINTWLYNYLEKPDFRKCE